MCVENVLRGPQTITYRIIVSATIHEINIKNQERAFYSLYTAIDVFSPQNY